eukprot:m.94428 g.94428  ORF g.94428 m.94428 type:complete len:421 (-) comp8570_c0_seq1:2404-3666(-)
MAELLFTAAEGDYRLRRELHPGRDEPGVIVPASHPHVIGVCMKHCASGTDTDGFHLIYNHHRDVFWHRDLAAKPLDVISFSKSFSYDQALPTCHDLNPMKRPHNSLELLIGFSSGEVVFRELISRRSTRTNTEGRLSKSAVTAIRWMPGEDQYLCGFADGTLLAMCLDRVVESALVIPKRPAPGAFQIVHSKEATNPAAQWLFGADTGAIHAIAFSPDCTCVAVACASGMLYVVDVRAERIVFSASSYFGALYCATWSPDGDYIITGGQDDLVTIWSFHEHDIVARAQGHSSWVTAVAFDPHRGTDEHCYRFGSVGQDARLCLWDFSAASLRQPRRNSMAAHLSPLAALRKKKKKLKDTQESIHISARPRSEVASLEPVVSARLHDEPLSAIAFRDDAVITACVQGIVRVWGRPPIATPV